MKTLSILAAAGVITCSGLAHATAVAYNNGYTFQETSGDPFTAELFLDQTSSTDGNKFDVGPLSYINSPDFDFTLGQVANLTVIGTFAWNSSQITSMDITGTYFSGGLEENFTLTANSIAETTTSLPDPGATGPWVGANFVPGAPDGGSTALMLGIVGGAIGLARRRFGRKA